MRLNRKTLHPLHHHTPMKAKMSKNPAAHRDCRIFVRTCPHRVNVRIFRHNFVGDKAKIRRRAVALQGFLTQSPAKFDENTCMNPYVDRFLYYFTFSARPAIF